MPDPPGARETEPTDEQRHKRGLVLHRLYQRAFEEAKSSKPDAHPWVWERDGVLAVYREVLGAALWEAADIVDSIQVHVDREPHTAGYKAGHAAGLRRAASTLRMAADMATDSESHNG